MHILLSNTSKEPLFQQIKEQIKKQIYQGELKEGEALPSIRLLAKQLQVSVITTKRAYEDLEKERFLVSSVGKGTFVAGQQPHVLKERQIRELENDLEQIVERAQQIGLTKQAMIERIHLFFD
ncbi:HTH-type transcriptional repressor YtrA [Paraliobacillus sp. PM-2]|uniref:GntR family transcriptional regulator n=1 Tax=Paraliobacillus sp. PM-2 TaxID=1462524 RepID=UPI00061BE09A|nr:GntR family transcriptional regulator [Paraliobacillus sp. PM-2]CQR48327.1 HTH-type transcriptional repressor YtrA [Paraliobacillus sp. PM-2]